MVSKIAIGSREEYYYLVKRGHDPLVDERHFKLTPELRKQIQGERFGTGHTPDENERFYRYVWNRKAHYCEECGRPLPEYSATYISHILTRGAHPEMAHDPRNTNILCFVHHEQWEHATTRRTMRVYQSNKRIIEELIKDYIKD